MSKNISAMFNGDVFDFSSQAQWVLENYYGYLDEGVQADKQLKLFSLTPIIPDANRVTDQTLPVIKGAAAVLNEQSPIEKEQIADMFATSNANLRLLFANKINESALRYCLQSGIKCFDTDTLYNIFQQYFAYQRPAFKKGDIAGMILVCKPELFERIKGINSEIFTYFKGGPTGKYLSKGHRALIYLESTAGHPNEGLCGVAEIEEVLVGTAAEVWNRFANTNPLFKLHEYNSFSKSKTCIIGISTSNSLKKVVYCLINDHNILCLTLYGSINKANHTKTSCKNTKKAYHNTIYCD